MNILVINGSPKGVNSITLQTSLFLEKKFPAHRFTYMNAAQSVGVWSKDFSRTADLLKSADLLVFCYPVYTFMAPSQLHRFLHAMKESSVDLKGKAATQITTSKHFYDITAHRYVRECLQDMGIHTIRGLSADMEDLTTDQGQAQAVSFMERVELAMKEGLWEETTRRPAERPAVAAVTGAEMEKTLEKTVAVVADITDEQLKGMVERFCASAPFRTRVIDIHAFPFKGGCLGCLQCAHSGVCVWKDGFAEMLREQIQTCDGTVYAFRIEDHSMGWRFKTYDDRQFCNGHRTVTMGSPVGYMVEGDLSCEENLRMVIDARAQVGGNFPAGCADDRGDTDANIDRLICSMTDALANRRSEPKNFFGVGGSKIFRDLIWIMRGIMTADHRFYKEHGFYDDLPQKKRGTMLAMCLVGKLMDLPQAKSKMNEGMLAPYKKVLEQCERENRHA